MLDRYIWQTHFKLIKKLQHKRNDLIWKNYCNIVVHKYDYMIYVILSIKSRCQQIAIVVGPDKPTINFNITWAYYNKLQKKKFGKYAV